MASAYTMLLTVDLQAPAGMSGCQAARHRHVHVRVRAGTLSGRRRAPSEELEVVPRPSLRMYILTVSPPVPETVTRRAWSSSATQSPLKRTHGSVSCRTHQPPSKGPWQAPPQVRPGQSSLRTPGRRSNHSNTACAGASKSLPALPVILHASAPRRGHEGARATFTGDWRAGAAGSWGSEAARSGVVGPAAYAHATHARVRRPRGRTPRRVPRRSPCLDSA